MRATSVPANRYTDEYSDRPTHDDITYSAINAAFSKEDLVYHDETIVRSLARNCVHQS